MREKTNKDGFPGQKTGMIRVLFKQDKEDEESVQFRFDLFTEASEMK
ncbi:hypothetical protein MST22_12170 [Virgibacillus halodenitrificans]|nr:hypothetical protein [Virgibacillus halodenitrificans]MCJ0931908.1 hypothetical protein [Virgibacillus halodenitrificans]